MSISADITNYIHSLVGKFYNNKCTLNAIMYHRSWFATQVQPATEWKKIDILADKRYEHPISSKRMRALAFHCPSTISSIDMISLQEYKDYLTLVTHITVDENDRWFELMNEKLMTVEAAIEQGIVTSIRLTTATRTSPSFGRKSQERLTFTVGDNQRICGFYGYSDGSRKLT